MKTSIHVDVFNPKSIQDAIDALYGKGEWVEQKCEELSRRLAEIGMREAVVSYQGAATEGNANVGVKIYPIDHGYAIEAYGEDVFFVEFGTGVMAGKGYETDEITPSVPITPGSWSETHAQKFSKDGYWYYGGKKYTGTQPYMGMYKASKAIKANLQKAAEEVFK